MPVPVQNLFEVHLAVHDSVRSAEFYRDVVGLELAHDAPEVGATFFWIGGRGKAMLGLWTWGSAPMRVSLHVAFEVALWALLDAPRSLRGLGVVPLSFFEQEADEPSVIGWMPAAAVYFRDPDGHLLEFLAMLDEPPRPDLGIVAWSAWQARAERPELA